jgi:uncharacterized protein involved in tolerance to divalent cations
MSLSKLAPVFLCMHIIKGCKSHYLHVWYMEKACFDKGKHVLIKSSNHEKDLIDFPIPYKVPKLPFIPD